MAFAPRPSRTFKYLVTLVTGEEVRIEAYGYSKIDDTYFFDGPEELTELLAGLVQSITKI